MTIKRIFLSTKQKVIIVFTICLLMLVSGGSCWYFFINQQQSEQTINKTNLNKLPVVLNIRNINAHDLFAFKSKLVITIKAIKPEFKKLQKADIALFQGSSIIPLKSSDIITNYKLEITIIAKSTSQNFTGSQNMQVHLITL